MANRRPIRAPRQRWRRGTRRPASWHDCYSTGQNAGNFGNAWRELTPLASGQPVSTLREILTGPVDTFYLDKEQVRIDRIVGNVQFWTASAADASVALPPVVRWGLIIEEDPNSENIVVPGPTTYNLWSNVHLDDKEWMWLDQPTPIPVHGPASDSGNIRGFHWSSYCDIRVRRNLGKSDRLWMVASFANGIEDTTGTGFASEWLSPVYECHQLRAILVA